MKVSGNIRHSLGLLLIGLLLAVGPLEAQTEVDPETLPLLTSERHVGTMFYGWGAPPPDAIQPRIDDAVAAGMNAFTVYLDWPALEPSPGVYDLVELQATLAWAAENGLSVFANITVIDIETLVMPGEFLGESGDVLAPDVRLDDPDLVARFHGLLDAVVPLMVEHGVFYVGVGNEVDGWFASNPDALDDYLRFIDLAREHVQQIEPRLAVGVTLSGNVPLYNPDFIEPFYTVADVVSSNIYGIDVADFTMTDAAQTEALLESFLAPFEDRPVVIPELGCNSAESMDSSPAIQAMCFDVMFDVLARYDNVRFVTVFTFHDFEPELCEAIQAAFGFHPDKAYDNIYDQRVAEYLCTLGVVDYDGSPKPAFDAFVMGVADLTGGAD